VRVLADNELSGSQAPGVETNTNQDTSFYESNQGTPLMISNEEFAKIPSDAYVLDAREDEEYEIGYYPGSHHIRFADIKSGEWIKLPTNQTIYVLCWSGIRGKEVAEFLRTKKILSRYVDKGADGWVAYGGKWNGGIKFRATYNEDRYKVVFTTDEVRQYVQQGVVIVDSRNAEKYAKRHIPGSISIPIIYTPSSKIEEVLKQVPPNSTVITVCDDFVSCFDATVTGVKLEKHGHAFLGRYNKPWEY
jgi:rhodanese-related sulfurtransferase